MDDALLDVVLARLDMVPLEQEAERLLLAACDSEAALAAELRGEGREDAEQRAGCGDAEPTAAYLRSIAAAGLRRIGPAATLALEPGPGLTLAVSRHGSALSECHFC